MIFRKRTPLAVAAAPDPEERAAEMFARRCLGTWSDEAERELAARLSEDAPFAAAFQRVEQSWVAVGKHATSPELIGLREQALSRARRSSARRRHLPPRTSWRRAAAAALIATSVAIALTAAYRLAPFGLRPGEYRTHIGEQRVVELEDHSHIALDAATRLRVRYSKDARVAQLLQGQAQFSVAKDPSRPFKVEAGNHTIVAVGTVFTVEYVDREVRVSTLEGKVAVLATPASRSTESATSLAESGAREVPLHRSRGAAHPNRSAQSPVELVAGEALDVQKDGATVVIPKADLQAANAWREGKVIFNNELLGDAVRRLNRYSRLQIVIADPALASMRVSGVFEAGDAQAFAEAVAAYLPATADYSESAVIRLQLD